MLQALFGRSNKSNKNIESVDDGEEKFTLLQLKRVHITLVENKLVTQRNAHTVVECLRLLAEMVVYGDANSELLFDFFCEKNMLPLFLEIMWSPDCPIVVHQQILQTLGILCQSVKNNTSLYYLLSNNYVNEVINYPHHFENENITEHFVSFLKTLSLRLTLQTVQFFFIEETGAFPLLTRAIGLLQFKEPMVRIGAQAIILNVYKVRDKRSRDYALQAEIMNRLFRNIVRLMVSQYNSLVALCVEHIHLSSPSSASKDESSGSSQRLSMNHAPSNAPEMTVSKYEELMHDLLINIEDWLYYLQDVIDLGIRQLRRALIQYLLGEFVYPVLLEPLSRLMSGGMLYEDNVFWNRQLSHRKSRSTSSATRDSLTVSDADRVGLSATLVVSLLYSQMVRQLSLIALS